MRWIIPGIVGFAIGIGSGLLIAELTRNSSTVEAALLSENGKLRDQAISLSSKLADSKKSPPKIVVQNPPSPHASSELRTRSGLRITLGELRRAIEGEGIRPLKVSEISDGCWQLIDPDGSEENSIRVSGSIGELECIQLETTVSQFQSFSKRFEAVLGATLRACGGWAEPFFALLVAREEAEHDRWVLYETPRHVEVCFKIEKAQDLVIRHSDERPDLIKRERFIMRIRPAFGR